MSAIPAGFEACADGAAILRSLCDSVSVADLDRMIREFNSGLSDVEEGERAAALAIFRRVLDDPPAYPDPADEAWPFLLDCLSMFGASFTATSAHEHRLKALALCVLIRLDRNLWGHQYSRFVAELRWLPHCQFDALRLLLWKTGREPAGGEVHYAAIVLLIAQMLRQLLLVDGGPIRGGWLGELQYVDWRHALNDVLPGENGLIALLEKLVRFGRNPVG